MSKDILPFYEREHGNLVQRLRKFSEENPQLASALGIVEGECTDPNLQRFTEAVVMMGAHVVQQIEDSSHILTAAVMNANYPHYDRPMPSASIARFDYGEREVRSMSGAVTIPRGTYLQTLAQQDVVYRFHTIYPVTIAPIVISSARFTTHCNIPPGVRLPQGATSMISITIESTSATMGLAQLGVETLRVFLDGDPSLRTTLRDLLFMQTVGAYVEADRSQVWEKLKQVPILAAGFREDEALLPCDARAHPAYRLLTEYFACPEKFNFIGIDLAGACKLLPPETRSLTLHLAITGAGVDTRTAQVLQPLSHNNFLLSCTPVVNLFKRAATPVDLSHTRTEYPLLASVDHAAAYEIHSVVSVRVVRDTPTGTKITEFHPYYAMRHGQAGGRRGHYWSIRRDSVRAQTSPGFETQIALTDIDLNPLALETATVSIDLVCTNRDLPSTLQLGQPNGDLKLERASGGYPIRLLRKPSATYRFPAEAHWRLISQLALNHRSLVQQDIAAFTELLQLHNLPQSPVQQRQIDAIAGLSFKQARCWLNDRHGGARVNGFEIHLTLDLGAFAGSGIHAFIQVLDHFFGLYAEINTYTQLCVFCKSTGKEIIRCLPRSGDSTLAQSNA
ncbi:MAG: type VI secretion system baseplate subunit TssF [Pseudomonadota bacterium]